MSHTAMSGATSVERTALKEWAVLVDAMARGEIVATVRKGGIREQRAGFSVRHDRFLLYPTFFHEKVDELDSRFIGGLTSVVRPPEGTIALSYVANVAGVWAVDDLDRLREIVDLQGLTWKAIESRFHYKGKPGVQVVALRVAKMAAVRMVPEIRRYAGCVSWVQLDQDVDVSGAVPVVGDAAFENAMRQLSSALGAASRI